MSAGPKRGVLAERRWLLALLFVTVILFGVTGVVEGPRVARQVSRVVGVKKVESHSGVICAAAAESGLDPCLLAGIMYCESRGQVDAVSPVGAQRRDAPRRPARRGPRRARAPVAGPGHRGRPARVRGAPRRRQRAHPRAPRRAAGGHRARHGRRRHRAAPRRGAAAGLQPALHRPAGRRPGRDRALRRRRAAGQGEPGAVPPAGSGPGGAARPARRRAARPLGGVRRGPRPGDPAARPPGGLGGLRELVVHPPRAAHPASAAPAARSPSPCGASCTCRCRCTRTAASPTSWCSPTSPTRAGSRRACATRPCTTS